MPPKPFVKYVIGSIGSLLASVLISVFLGPFPLWLEVAIFVVPLVLIDVALARHEPSTTKAPRKSSTLLSLIVWSYLVWSALNHHNQQKWLNTFEKGRIAYEARDYPTAQKGFSDAIAFAQKIGDTDRVCKGQKYMGNLCLNQEKYSDAEKMFMSAVSNCTAVFSYGDLIASQRGLGKAYQAGGDYIQANDWLQKALGTARKNLGPQDPELAAVLNDLGVLQQDEGECALAEPALRQALAIWEKSPDSETAELVRGYNNLGSALNCGGKLDEAEVFYRKSLDLGEKEYGQDSPAISLALNNLALLYRRRGNPGEESSIRYGEDIPCPI